MSKKQKEAKIRCVLTGTRTLAVRRADYSRSFDKKDGPFDATVEEFKGYLEPTGHVVRFRAPTPAPAKSKTGNK